MLFSSPNDGLHIGREEIVKSKKQKNSNSKVFKCLMNCLRNGRHSHMLKFINAEETIFEVKAVNKKSPHWTRQDITLFEEVDEAASGKEKYIEKRKKKKYEENAKGRFRANMAKLILAKYFRKIDPMKDENDACISYWHYEILLTEQSEAEAKCKALKKKCYIKNIQKKRKRGRKQLNGNKANMVMTNHQNFLKTTLDMNAGISNCDKSQKFSNIGSYINRNDFAKNNEIGSYINRNDFAKNNEIMNINENDIAGNIEIQNTTDFSFDENISLDLVDLLDGQDPFLPAVVEKSDKADIFLENNMDILKFNVEERGSVGGEENIGENVFLENNMDTMEFNVEEGGSICKENIGENVLEKLITNEEWESFQADKNEQNFQFEINCSKLSSNNLDDSWFQVYQPISTWML